MPRLIDLLSFFPPSFCLFPWTNLLLQNYLVIKTLYACNTVEIRGSGVAFLYLTITGNSYPYFEIRRGLCALINILRNTAKSVLIKKKQIRCILNKISKTINCLIAAKKRFYCILLISSKLIYDCWYLFSFYEPRFYVVYHPCSFSFLFMPCTDWYSGS